MNVAILKSKDSVTGTSCFSSSLYFHFHIRINLHLGAGEVSHPTCENLQSFSSSPVCSFSADENVWAIPQLLPFQHKCDINLTHLLPSRSCLFISSEKICWGSGGFITHSRALPSKLPTICTIAPCRQFCSNCFHLLMKSCRSLNLRLLEEGPGKEPRHVWKVNEIHNLFKYVIISHEHNRTFCACIGDILYQNIHPTMTSSNTSRYISYASGIGHLFQYHPLGLSWVRHSTHFIPISKQHDISEGPIPVLDSWLCLS